MIKKEWRNLLHNKILIIVMIAIIAIPAIYTTLFLGSMWDPYGQLTKLPVAVVNHDKAVRMDGESLSVGSTMVDSLKDNKSLDFRFVDEETAEKGLKDGKYYMVIKIPENFSKNAATVMDENPSKMELAYETNPGTNYIASKLSESAMTKLKAEVTSEVTKTYTSALFDKMHSTADGVIKAGSGAETLNQGLIKLKDGGTTLSDSLSLLKKNSLTFVEGTKSLNEGAKAYTDGVAKADDGAARLELAGSMLKDGTGTISGKLPSLDTGVTALLDGSDALSVGSGSVLDGATILKEGTQEADEKLGTLSDGLNQMSAVVSELPGATDTLSGAVSALTDGAGSVQTGSESLLDGASKAADGSGAVLDGLNYLADTDAGGAAALYSGYDELENQIIASVMQTLADGQAIGGGAGTEQEADMQAADGQAVDGQAADGQTTSGQAADEQAAVQAAAEQSQALQSALEGAFAAYRAQGLDTYVGGVTEAKNGSDSLNQALEGIKSGASDLKNGSDGLKAGLDTLNASTGDLSDKANTLSGTLEVMADGAGKLRSEGTSQLKSGADALYQGISSVKDGSERLNTGIHTLSSQLPELENGVQQLDGGTKALAEGTKTLYDGTSTLVSKSEDLLLGAATLQDGAEAFSEAGDKLSNGANTLKNGINTAADGSDTLSFALLSGAKEADKLKTTDKTLSMFSSPLTIKETKLTNVPDNGHAMAAYMMSVGLWVACIAFCIMYPLTKYQGELKSGTAWWASKATVVYPVAVIMSVVMIGLLHLFNGFSPEALGKTLLMAAVAGVAFMSILYFFNVLFGKVGSFLMLIFMVVQLAGSTGTYPMELSGAFVSKIHKYLPFTYTVDAFRSTIAGGESISHELIALIVIAIVFTVLTIIIFEIRAVKIKRNKRTGFEILEKSGLA